VSLLVIDASVLVAFYAADDPRRAVVAERLKAGATLFAPAHLDAGVVSALRGMARGNPTLERAVPNALMTCDARLAAANGPTCAFDLIA
jgi:predicted nucleic acid-binding protein